ncbi:hypothetical protein PAXRUDRAFT_828196 [Paxillus rubicundulus Ve08.2h10]|uniref:Uncharacterized protein n=1 Tax=Paxillus rubicundulus Ve08.2h10 TaxID=930991 RepID=A0A0D0DQ04_9AGAM|nr:hypothetical protein PAXRUDRAFT_828196 [Paxillus rubicundulus Ve08.2h10]
MAHLLLNTDRTSHQSFSTSLIALCSEVLESPAQYDKYKVFNINHFKERSQVGHEFIILDVFNSDGRDDAFRLRAERRPSRRKADEQTRAERPVLRLDALVTVSDDTISRVPESFSERDFDHLSSLGPIRPPISLSFALACKIFQQVENHSWYYALFRRQCYWFCITFMHRVSGTIGVPERAGNESWRRGAAGKGRIPARLLKVMPDRRAAGDIREEEMKQKTEETKREDEAHEAMNKALTTAVVRREVERSTSFERTRQTVLPLLRTTEARREAEVQAWQATFSQLGGRRSGL